MGAVQLFSYVFSAASQRAVITAWVIGDVCDEGAAKSEIPSVADADVVYADFSEWTYYLLRTDETCCDWCRLCVLFHKTILGNLKRI